jgi:hypothetical protein
MSEPGVFLLLLHVVILVLGSTLLWAVDRRPRTVVIVSGFIIACGGLAMWFAGNVMEAHGLEAGGRLLRIGQWAVALGIAAWGLVAVFRRGPRTPAAVAGWKDWAMALAAYWFLCFVVALVEGFIIFLGRTPHEQFR